MSHPVMPLIALVGRTNVGKSTLFNRLVEHSRALVSHVAGTTRDRKEGECLWRGRVIKIVDTGGLDVKQETEIEKQVVRQAELAMKQADVILFVVDLREGPLPQDIELARELRKTHKPVIVVGNKAEKLTHRTAASSPEWRLAGHASPIPISAATGAGVGDLLDSVYDELKRLKKEPAEITQVKASRISVIGKPSVGKSSLLNSILGEERFITSPIAHTTREPNDVLVEIGDKSYLLIDTAGLRKNAKVKKAGGLEEAGVERTKRVLRHTDVALFVLDASKPIDKQERVLAGLLQETHVGVIIVANKWDLVPGKTTQSINQFQEYITGSLPFLRWAPILFVSAKTGQRVHNLFEMVDNIERRRYTQIPETELDKFWRAAVRRHLPSKGKGPKPPTMLGFTQISVAPPTFQLFIKARRLDVLHPSYLRFLENRLREQFDLEGTPVVITVRGLTSV